MNPLKTLITICLFAMLLFMVAPNLLAQDPTPPPAPTVETGGDLDMFTAMFKQVTSGPGAIILIAIVSIIAWLIDYSAINSKVIPWFCIVFGGLGYPLFNSPGTVSPNFPHPMAVLVGNGIICGFLSFVVGFVAIKKFTAKRINPAAPLLLGVLALSLGGGCGTLSPAQQTALLADLQDVAYVGTRAALLKNPEYRPALITTRDTLAKLAALPEGQVTPDDLTRVLSELPLEQFQNDEAVQLAIVGGRAVLRRVFAATGASETDVGANGKVRAAAQALAAGMTTALKQANRDTGYWRLDTGDRIVTDYPPKRGEDRNTIKGVWPYLESDPALLTQPVMPEPIPLKCYLESRRPMAAVLVLKP